MSKNYKFVSCEWCGDNTCKNYYELQVFKTFHRLCHCCYSRLNKTEGSPRCVGKLPKATQNETIK